MECLNDCYHNTSCTAVDWNPSSDVGGRCWLHGGWSSGSSRNTRSGIQHFAITRRCGWYYTLIRTYSMCLVKALYASFQPVFGSHLVFLNFETLVDIFWAEHTSYLDSAPFSTPQKACVPYKLTRFVSNSSILNYAHFRELCLLVDVVFAGQHFIRCLLKQWTWHCLTLTLTLLVLLTSSCERWAWTRHEDTNVNGGRHRSSSSTFTQCQSTCVNDADCTAIDWNQASSQKCWHHGSWSEGNVRNNAPGIDHYQLTRNPACTGKSNTSVRILAISPAYW